MQYAEILMDPCRSERKPHVVEGEEQTHQIIHRCKLDVRAAQPAGNRFRGHANLLGKLLLLQAGGG